MMEPTVAHRDTGGEAKGTLYVVATPIGNLRDITLRAIEVLKAVSFVAAEDTRVTAKLLNHYGIAAKLIAVHGHNERRATARVLALLAAGHPVALVTDAGTPAVSDPGAHVVAAARAAGHAVTPVPGANAAVAALSAAGLSEPHFLFYGFLPQRAADRRRSLDALRMLPYAIVFYEAPHRVADSVADLAAAFGGARRIVIARELTKVHEAMHECALADAPAWLGVDANRRRGEFVLIVRGSVVPAAAPADEHGRVLGILLDAMPLKQAVALAAEISGGRRNDLYAMALRLRDLRPETGE